MKRAVIIVLDSVGIGELPDAGLYGDEGSNTLVNIKKAFPKLDIKNLVSLGLGNIQGGGIESLGKAEAPMGCFGKMAEASVGKDTTTGHWEIAGIITKKAFPVFTKTGFPEEIMESISKACGVSFIGNYAESGTKIIEDLGAEHMRTGSPIVYTSADSVFQIAAHEDIIPVSGLYEICAKAREILTGDYGVARVIARPFAGKPGSFARTGNRKDFSLPPTSKMLLDYAAESSLTVAAVGKIKDIFLGRGINLSNHTKSNREGVLATIDFMNKTEGGIIFSNLVDFDMLYGHRNDIEGYARALEEFDKMLPEILKACRKDDIIFITADHGCDPTTTSTDHSREYVPLIVWGEGIKKGVDLGIRHSFADIGKTAAEYLGILNGLPGESFLSAILEKEEA